MITAEQAYSWFKYQASFDDFARDLFDIDTTQDLTGQVVNCGGPEELIIAHLTWNLLFKHERTYMVACPNQNLARHWRELVGHALFNMPEYLRIGLSGSRDEIRTERGDLVLFRSVNENTCRGMTINGLYIIEPDLFNKRTYEEFMIAAIPTMTAGKNRQTVIYGRGY